MNNINTNFGVASCQSSSTVQGLGKYWSRGTCNKSTCKYQHTCVACIQPLKVTRSQEITLLITQQVTLSPSDAAEIITQNYKNSQMGITILLDTQKSAATLNQIVRGNARDKMMQKEEVEKMLLLQKGSKQQQGILNRNKNQNRAKQESNQQSRQETKIDQSNQSIFPPSQNSTQQTNQLIKQQKYSCEKVQLLLNKISKQNLDNQSTLEDKTNKNKTVSKGILKNKENMSDSSTSSQKPISPIQKVGASSFLSLSQDSQQSQTSSAQSQSPLSDTKSNPKKCSKTITTQKIASEATTNKWQQIIDNLGKKEEEYHKLIQALQIQMEKISLDQTQVKKEFDLLLSLNSSKKEDSPKSNKKQTKK